MKTPCFVLVFALAVSACSAPAQVAGPADYGCAEAALRGTMDPRDVQQAKRYFSEGCSRGSQEACSALGVMVEEGRGFEPNRALARELYQGACEAGIARACANLGTLEEVDNPRVAATLFRLGCEDDDLRACAGLGRLVRDGRGTFADAALASRLFERACTGGIASACGDLAGLAGARTSVAEPAAMLGCALGDARSCALYASLGGRL